MKEEYLSWELEWDDILARAEEVEEGIRQDLEDEMEGAIFVLNCTVGVNAIEDLGR